VSGAASARRPALPSADFKIDTWAGLRVDRRW